MIDEVLKRGGEPDETLRAVVSALVDEGCSWAGILFAEGDELVLGPQAGEPDPGARVQLPVVYAGARVAELVVDGCSDTSRLDEVAAKIAELCLVGWDTDGEPWAP